MSRWLLYALGGGLGHFQRSLALARAASKRGIASTVLTNSPWAPRILSLVAGWLPATADIKVRILPVDVAPLKSQQRIKTLLAQSSVLVVDTFPRGLGGELAELLEGFGGYKVWVHRDISPEYLQKFEIRDRWALKYDCIVAPGERVSLADMAVYTPPWLFLDHDEVLARESARLAWDLPRHDQRPVVLVVGCGKASEAEAFASIHTRLRQTRPNIQVRFAGLNRDDMQWPLIANLRAADLVVGSGGYNTVHEAEALRIPLIGIAQPRMYDRQARRLREHAFCSVEPGPDLVDRVLLAVDEGLLAGCADELAAVPPFNNGAGVAVERIESAR